MTKPKSAQDVPTTDRLRHDIDSGVTGDKIDFPDPAAAPLGTDAEAAGTSAGPEEVALEIADNHVTKTRRTVPGAAIYTATASIVAVGILTAAAIG